MSAGRSSPVTGRTEHPLRVLVVHSSYLSGSASGENRVVEDEISLLRERGHDVVAWVESPEDQMRNAALLGARAVWSGQAARELRKLIRRLRPQVIHGHNLFPMLSPAIIRVARSEGVPFVLTLHNYRLMCLPATFLRDGRPCEDCLGHLPWRGVLYRCYRGSIGASGALAASLSLHRAVGTFDDVSLFLAVSELVRDKHVEAGVAPERIRVKPNFAWIASRRRGPGSYFIYLGRLGREKGLDVLMRAWRDIDATLMVAGGGDWRSELESISPQTVSFVGSLSSWEAGRLLAGARALILPSIWYEGAPRSIAEAYAAGVPVIASRIGSLPEFVEDGRTGCLVPPGDAGALAEAVRSLQDDARSMELGEGAHRVWQERFTPERGAAALESAYETALSRAGSSA